MAETISARMIQKHGTMAQWEANPIVPRAGEIIIYDPDNYCSYSRLKIGDGKTSAPGLPFLTSGDGQIGVTGEPGVGISSVELNSDYTLTIHYTDGTYQTTGSVRGPQGKAGENGEDGVSATHSWNGTVLTITSASGTSSADLKGSDGKTPTKGVDYFTQSEINSIAQQAADLVEVPDVDLTGVVKSVNGNKPDSNGNVQINVGSGGSGEAGEDGGYYVPSVEQNGSQLVFSFESTKIGMENVSDITVNLPAGANGRSAYEYAQEGGYTGTEKEWTTMMANGGIHIGDESPEDENIRVWIDTDEQPDSDVVGGTGTAAGFGTPTATIDSGVGTPSVTVTASGPDTAKVFSFAFKNLKGEPGEAASSGVGQAGTGEGAEIFNDYVNNTASGDYAHAEGIGTTASGEGSHAEGEATEASGAPSHAEGYLTKATARGAHAEGYKSQALAGDAHAEGSSTIADGASSHAEGSGSEAHALGSHAEGDNAQTIRTYWNVGGVSSPTRGQHAEGSETEAHGWAAHAEGSRTKAINDYSHAEGYCTEAASDYQHVQGKFNKVDKSGTYVHIVGWGSNTSVRANIHTVSTTGQGYFKGNATTSGGDYAEYFEWLDGNPNNEDRIGRIVALDGDKIYLANSGEEVLGIISGTAGVIGDNPECDWQGRFLVDNYGREIMEEVEEFRTFVDPETKERKQFSIGTRLFPKLNPEYDETKTYLRRADRPEWDIVGLMGKLHVNDDGTCVPNGYAKCGGNGVATASTEKTNMRVMKRITDNIILVFMK